MTTSLFFLLLLACPLMMIFMMRGHGHGVHTAQAAQGAESPESLDELKRRRAALDAEISFREGR